ncbi:MAG: serine protease, partial [Cyanobacteria bacterium J06638_38]
MKHSPLKEPELTSSVALIESKNIDSNNFGSGFLIYRDSKATYWLTCAHVIKDIGKLDDIRVGKLPAQLIGPSEDKLASSLKNSFDLAVLRVEGLFKKKPVQLGKPIDRNSRFLAAGHFQNSKTKQIYFKEVSGNLHVDSLNIISTDKFAWVLALEVDEDFSLEPGYSGSPVFVPESQRVIGVVEQRQGGNKGQAIAVDAANTIFQTVPELESMLRIQSSQATLSNRFATWAMTVIEHPLRWVIGAKVRAALNWMLQEGISTLARKASDYALNTSQDLNEEIQRFPEEDRSSIISDFQWEIEKYLERIYGSLLTDSQDLLE